MEPYAIQSEYDLLDGRGSCGVRACPYPAFEIVVWDHWTGSVEKRFTCQQHFLIGQFAMSMEYEDADTLLCIPKPTGGSTSHTSAQWDHARIVYLRRQGFSYKASTAVIANEAIDQGANTHYADAVFNVFTELRRSLIYSMCGEKVMDSLTKPRSENVTCPTCRRMAAEKLAALPPIPAKQPIITAPKEKPKKLSFEELVATESMWMDDQAFSNRRNWGERSGRVWSDPTKGVQREKRLRGEVRGGVNRKRG